jgi:apolipoprotein N-acyltransferase
MKQWIKDILLALLSALFFSAFIYLADYGLHIKLLNTILGLAAIALVLYIPKRALLISGFLIGLFWFYWIGYSFKYQGVGYMQPIVTLGFGFIYLILFTPIALTQKPILRAFFLFILSYIEPFGWNWFKPELLFVESYFGIYKYQFAIILLSLSLPSLTQHKIYRFAPLILLLGAVNYNTVLSKNAPLKIKLLETNIAQENKWKKSQLYPTLNLIFSNIKKAQEEKYDLIVLPESVFPLFLNRAPQLIETLKKASYKIAIVTGALYIENNKHYNVSYKFENGSYTVAKKLVLVPFGEYIPLPKFMREFINKTFFSGASDFVTAKAPSNFIIKGVKFRNAICYEATTDAIYKNTPPYVIAISNNAWFTPSIEPTLQHLLLRYYAKKYKVTIYHATNGPGTGVIR